jgi:hypothetical protein
MGIDPQALRFLLLSKGSGVSFESFLMIGRQGFHSLKPKDLQNALAQQGLSLTPEDAAHLLHARSGYVEPLLELLGAKRIESLDYSSYEQASISADLNNPVEEYLSDAFSCVLDSGTLEHVFNFPQAIKNCMNMVSIGGHFVAVTTANNFMGHGFYQFSPELYYRILSEENGFLVEEMILCGSDRGSPWYRVADPNELGRRVEPVNGPRTYLMVRARKLRHADVFSVSPQQSDYEVMWSSRSTRALDPETSWHLMLRGLIPEVLKRPLRRLLGHKTPGAFQRIQ